MAITMLEDEAFRESTYVIVFSFDDEDDNDVTPNVGTVTWTLTDVDGNVINSREAVAVASAATISVALQGDDLSIQTIEADEEAVKRYFLAQGEYNSNIGSGLPCNMECGFLLRNSKYAI